MKRNLSRRLVLASAGSLMALIIGPALAQAQSGQRGSGEPVTGPKTNATVPSSGTATPPPSTTAEILPPVPASAQNPAPPGTRAVQLPGTSVLGGEGLAQPAAGGQVQPGLGQAQAGRQMRGVRVIEGTVIDIQRPSGGDDSHEMVRLVIDSSRDWMEHVSGPPVDPKGEDNARGDEQAGADRDSRPIERIVDGINEVVEGVQDARKSTEARRDLPALDAQAVRTAAPESATAGATLPGDPTTRGIENQQAQDARAAADLRAAAAQSGQAAAPGQAQPLVQASAEDLGRIEVVITDRTRVNVHARTRDGIDLYGVETISSPSVNREGTGVNGAAPNRQTAGPMETNFTNIRVGSFVVVRFLENESVNQALNINLIEFPLIDPTQAGGTGAGAAVGQPGAGGPPPAGAVPGSGVIGPVAPDGGIPAQGAPRVPTGNPTRPTGPAEVPVVPTQPVPGGTRPG